MPGPESYLAGRPLLLVTVILGQIVVTLGLVGYFASAHRHPAVRVQPDTAGAR